MTCQLLGLCGRPELPAAGTLMVPNRCLQIDYYCRLDCLWKKKFKKEHEEFETMENVNRLLLENVLPAHVAAHFIGDKLNEVWARKGLTLGWGGRGHTCMLWRGLRATRCCLPLVSVALGFTQAPRLWHQRPGFQCDHGQGILLLGPDFHICKMGLAGLLQDQTSRCM